MTAWDFYAGVGIATLTVFGLWAVRDIIITIIVVRIGWTRLEQLGFWRGIWAALWSPTRRR